MGKFDDLFDEFFNEGEKPKSPEKNDDMGDITKVLKNLISLKKTGDTDALDNCLNDSLGEPDFVEFYEEDNMYFKREIWHTKMGKFVKTGMSDIPFKDEHNESNFSKEPIIKNNKSKKPTKSLDIMLEEAVAKEDYELAATLRDEIKRRVENS